MKNTILKWFDLLPFPTQWRQEVAEAAETFSTEAEHTPMWDLLYALSRCDKTEKIYKEKNIGRDILIDTLSDIVVWAENQYLVHGTVGLSDAGWLEGHLEGKLFRLGRLQFKMEQAICSDEKYDLNEGDPVLEIHIPQGEPMNMEDVHASYRRAKEFFTIYFPEYDMDQCVQLFSVLGGYPGLWKYINRQKNVRENLCSLFYAENAAVAFICA